MVTSDSRTKSQIDVELYINGYHQYIKYTITVYRYSLLAVISFEFEFIKKMK